MSSILFQLTTSNKKTSDTTIDRVCSFKYLFLISLLVIQVFSIVDLFYHPQKCSNGRLRVEGGEEGSSSLTQLSACGVCMDVSSIVQFHGEANNAVLQWLRWHGSILGAMHITLYSTPSRRRM